MQPHLEYPASVWSPKKTTEIEAVESVQQRAAFGNAKFANFTTAKK